MKDNHYRRHIAIPSSQMYLSQVPLQQSFLKENRNPLREKLTSKDLERIFCQDEYSSEGNHQRLIENLKTIQCNEDPGTLQQYCIRNFSDLPLLMLYEVGKEFNLQGLSFKCQESLIGQNYEQLNINKFDLIKLSLPTFQKLLRDYRAHANNLQIFGLKQSDLKSIVDDYCSNNATAENTKRQLQEEFVKNNNFIPTSDDQKEVRRSMINLNRVTPPAENIFTPDRRVKKLQSVPYLLNESEILTRNSQTPPSPELNQNLSKNGMIAEALEVRKMIQENHERQNKLYSQIVDLSKECSKNPNKRMIKEGIRNVEMEIAKFEKEMSIQKQKLSRMSSSVRGISEKRGKNRGKEIDFVFQY